MPTAQNRRAIGGNFPPSPIELDPVKELTDRLARDYAKLAKDFLNYEIGIGNLPAKVETDEQAGKVSDFIAQCMKLIAESKSTHKKVKEPLWALGKAVDAWFLRRNDGLLEKLLPARKRLTDFQQAKQRALRERQEAARITAAAEAKRAAEEAQKAREEAEMIKTIDRDAAVALRWQAHAADDAAKAAAAIVAAPLARAQIRGSLGSLTYAKEGWDFEVEDPGSIPITYLQVDEAAVRRAIARGVYEIPGLRIYPVSKTITKGS